MEMNKLHFLRLRNRNSGDPFCDPLADIKTVVQQMFREIPMLYKELFKDQEKTDLLKAYFKVFVTRIEEDAAPLNEQLDAFYKAMNKLLTKEEHIWLTEYISNYILSTFALHHRRDGAVDVKERMSMRSASAVLSLQTSLSKATMEKVLEELEGAAKFIKAAPPDVTVDALCVEDGNKTIKNIKENVANLMSPGDSWEDVAKACDSYAMNSIDEEKAVSAALAYPDYKTPYFEVESDGNRESAAKT